MSTLLGSGIILGLAAGLAPGPLLTLVVGETLRHGSGAGVLVALAPVVTDAPIVLASLFLLSHLSDLHTLLGLIALCGAGYVLLLAWQHLHIQAVHLNLKQSGTHPLLKGVFTNLLNPHPYLFWVTVGAPLMLDAMPADTHFRDVVAPLLFLAGFYACLIGSKVVLAVLTGRARGLLAGRAYLYSMRLLGGLLGLLALSLLHDGLQLLGIWP